MNRDRPPTSVSRLTWAVAVGFSLFIGLLIVAANTGIEHPGQMLVRWLPYGDKIGHVVLFGGLALVVNLALACRTVSIGRLSVLIGSVLVLGFVAVEELSQGFVDGRTRDPIDFAANLVGIVIATVVAPRIHRRLGSSTGRSSPPAAVQVSHPTAADGRRVGGSH